MVDGVTAAWMMEFLLRQPVPKDLLNELIFALPLPSPFPSRLRRTFLLHRLNSDLSAGFSPSVDTLHFLKLLLDGGLGASPSCYDSLAAAYRAVALHCVADSASSSFRVLAEELCTGVSELEVAQPALKTLRKLLMELKALLTAASDNNAAPPGLFGEDTRAAALDAIRACLKTSFEDLGPCFLERAAEIAEKNGTDFGKPPGRDFDNDDSGVGKGEVSSTSLQKEMDSSEALANKLDPISTPEFKNVTDALKTSCMDLQRVVDDPLVDAVKLADEVLMRQLTLKTNDGVSKRSLMDKKQSAHTYEWEDDLTGSSSENSSTTAKPICLPDLQTVKTSPLVPMDIKKNLRRRMKKWTVLEEDALRTAVQKYGRKWKLILNEHSDVFEERTEVDLKDKWRNMTKG